MVQNPEALRAVFFKVRQSKKRVSSKRMGLYNCGYV